MARHDVNKDATAETRRRGAEKAAEAKRAKKEAERALLTEARRDHLDEAIELLSVAAKRAAAKIDELLDANSETVQLRAAEDVIKILVDVEILEMAGRLDRLEELASSRNGSG
jgi:hypothetical protein